MIILEDLQKFANGLRTLIAPSFNSNVLKGFDPRVVVQQMDKIKQYINVPSPTPQAMENYRPTELPKAISFAYHVPSPTSSSPAGLPHVQMTPRTFSAERVQAVQSQFLKLTDVPVPTRSPLAFSPHQPLQDLWDKIKAFGQYNAPSVDRYDLRAILGSFFLPVAIPAILGIAGAIGEALKPAETSKEEDPLPF